MKTKILADFQICISVPLKKLFEKLELLRFEAVLFNQPYLTLTSCHLYARNSNGIKISSNELCRNILMFICYK